MGRERGVVEVLPDRGALMRRAAERFAASAEDAIAASGRFVVALSGGSTPEELYRLLARDPFRGRVDWSRVHLYWGDERCVPPDDPSSNYRMVRRALLDQVPVPAAQVHRLRGEAEPAAAAAECERALRDAFGAAQGPPPVRPGARFDLVLLGLGANGHTASLFPGLAAVRETERWVMAELVPEVSMWRLTLTPPLINAAAEACFLVAGGEKAAMLREVLEGPVDPRARPAQAIAPRAGVLRWLVDAEAAVMLGESGRRSP